VPNDFGPGWHRKLGPIDGWTIFDSTVQTLEMTRDPERGDRKGRDDVRVKSADGYSVSVDLTVKYRIKPGEAHKLYQDTGSGTKYKTVVRNSAENACMMVFGRMDTEAFYDPAQRRARTEEVTARLTETLASRYVELVDILMRDVQFDPEYENKIRQKKLADQEVELNKSLARAEEMSGKTAVIEAETEKKVRIITEEKEALLQVMEAETNKEIASVRAEAEKYVKEKKADADLIDVKCRAQGELAIKQAEAEGERLRNEALSAEGGDTYVALEAARNLKINRITISTVGLDLLDVEGMAEKLGAKPTTGELHPKPPAEKTAPAK
jgi:regulator of protease activity HflC (stomatin/prohibitin superfamily)